jgi:long-chain acyl-CoA synthetase
MLLGPSGENIYPEAIESKLNSLPLVGESLVLEKNGKLMALVYPDMEVVDREKIPEKELAERMEENRKTLNALMPAYINIAKIFVHPEEFEKTPTKKVKRFLYTVPE